MGWFKLKCNFRDLQLIGTLNGGQSFRWKLDDKTNEWVGVYAKTVWKLQQEDEFLNFKVIGSLHKAYNDEKVGKCEREKANEKYFANLLRKYFRLDVALTSLYKEWADKDEIFKNACQQFYGIRMLNQDSVENLFSFICSQNNHISRISGMVEKLCSNYGEKICEIDGIDYYAFPDVEVLADNKVEGNLRELGFGYRAKFIYRSAEQIVEWGKEDWLRGLENMKYKEARQELMKLVGIGPKVSDCICLMSLNHLESVPVDTHVYQIAAQHYLPHLRGKKSVTEKMYSEIGDHFRSLFGPLAGWAHTVLFCADLKKFQQNEVTEKPQKLRKRMKCS